jgi:hypothetical protein
MLLMDLRDVPDPEADAVRALLAEHGIEFYETPPNRWGITAGGIWVHRDDQLTEAKRLLDDFQRQLQARVRTEYEERKRAGTAPTFGSALRANPLRVLFLLGIVALVLYLTLVPFLRLV